MVELVGASAGSICGASADAGAGSVVRDLLVLVQEGLFVVVCDVLVQQT